MLNVRNKMWLKCVKFGEWNVYLECGQFEICNDVYPREMYIHNYVHYYSLMSYPLRDILRLYICGIVLL